MTPAAEAAAPRGWAPRRRWSIGLVVLTVLFVAAAVAAGRGPTFRRSVRKATRAALGRRARFSGSVEVHEFQKGNVHTHSLESDGKASLEAMVAWYRDHGYQFVAMTEHNQRVNPDALHGMETGGFVVIAGEELTNSWGGRIPLHVNALCAREEIGGGIDYGRAEDGLAEVFGLVRARGGVPLVDHPNFHFSLGADQIAQGASGPYLLEIWSGHPDVHPGGDAAHPSAEAIWDELVARGADAAPAAVDDAHELVAPQGQPAALPGRAWVETFGGETSRAAICAALAAGQLVASSGPHLGEIRVAGETFDVGIDEPGATVEFVGERGETLGTARPTGSPPIATYRLTGGETSVRARVSTSGRGRAWTPAYRVTDSP